MIATLPEVKPADCSLCAKGANKRMAAIVEQLKHAVQPCTLPNMVPAAPASLAGHH